MPTLELGVGLDTKFFPRIAYFFRPRQLSDPNLQTRSRINLHGSTRDICIQEYYFKKLSKLCVSSEKLYVT